MAQDKDNIRNAYVQKAHILIKGGTAVQWASSPDQILNGELVYGTEAVLTPDRKTLSILKIGDGTKDWSSLGVDRNGMLDNSVFFSGRGAGIEPAKMSDNLNTSLGAVRVHANTEKNKKYGIQIDHYGFLRLWTNENGLTSLDLDELHVKNFTADQSNIKLVVEGNDLILRSKAEASLIAGESSGIIVNKYNGKDNTAIKTDVFGDWFILKDNSNLNTKRLIATVDEKIMEGPVVWMKQKANPQKNIPEMSFLSSWQPNRLQLIVNQDPPQTYSPWGEENSVPSFKLKTLTQVTIKTKEIDNSTLPENNVYEVDDQGNLEIVLPTVTGYAIDSWNSKIDDVYINDISLKTYSLEQDKQLALIKVHAEDLLADGTICSPIHKINYDEVDIIPNENYVAKIIPDKYKFKTEDDKIVLLGTSSFKKDHEIIVTIKGKHAQAEVSRNDIQVELGDYASGERNDTIRSDINNFDDYGHVNSHIRMTYSIKKLLSRIDELEKKVAALEGK